MTICQAKATNSEWTLMYSSRPTWFWKWHWERQTQLKSKWNWIWCKLKRSNCLHILSIRHFVPYDTKVNEEEKLLPSSAEIIMAVSLLLFFSVLFYLVLFHCRKYPSARVLQPSLFFVYLPGAWHYRVSTQTGWSGVSILWMGEVESLICNCYPSMAACKLVWADPSMRYTSMLLRQTNRQICP